MSSVRRHWRQTFSICLIATTYWYLGWQAAVYLLIVFIAYYVGKAEGLRDGYRYGVMSRHPVRE